MSEQRNHPCPTCQGKKIIDGICEVSPEWQGVHGEDDTICTPEAQCPTCEGSGIEIIDGDK